MPANFLALYRGESPESARLVAVASEPAIVEKFLRALAGETEDAQEECNEVAEPQPLRVLRGGDDE